MRAAESEMALGYITSKVNPTTNLFSQIPTHHNFSYIPTHFSTKVKEKKSKKKGSAVKYPSSNIFVITSTSSYTKIL